MASLSAPYRKEHMRKSFLLFAILLVIHVVVNGPAVGQEKTIIRISGAAVAADQMQTWANEFMQSHKDINVVVTGSSAGKGFRDLFAGTAEVALASREITPAEVKIAQEKEIRLGNLPIGYSGLLVVTCPTNKVNELSLDQLRRIYTGEITNWNEIGGAASPMRAFSRRIPESGAAVFFWQTVLHQEPFGKSVTMAETFSSIAKVCATAADCPVGVVPTIYARAAVKPLSLRKDADSPAVAPTEANIKSKTYPLVLPFSVYYDANKKTEKLMSLLSFCAQKGGGAQ